MSGTVRVRLLGRLGIEHGQRWLDGSALPGRQGRIVLAYLALCHYPVSRDELADLVWPDALTAAWERDLSAVVSKVRAALDSVDLGSLLHGALGCYELQLPPTSRVDVEDAVRFVEDAESAWRVGNRDVALPAAATAANLARRPFLPAERGLWIERRRDDLRATLLRALDLLAQGLTGGPYRGRRPPLHKGSRRAGPIPRDQLRPTHAPPHEPGEPGRSPPGIRAMPSHPRPRPRRDPLITDGSRLPRGARSLTEHQAPTGCPSERVRGSLARKHPRLILGLGSANRTPVRCQEVPIPTLGRRCSIEGG